MGSTGNQKQLNKPVTCLHLPLWVLTAICVAAVKGNATTVTLHEVVGGNLTISCPVKKDTGIQFLYFQKGNIFINGFHRLRKDLKNVWPNTKVEVDLANGQILVHIYGLNVSHNAVYQCIVEYVNTDEDIHTYYQLNITAAYSQPKVEEFCSNGGCEVTCESHGGYPEAVMWLNGTSALMGRDVNCTQVPNQSDGLFSSYCITYFNCSHGERESLRFLVGNVKSKEFSVCKAVTTPESHITLIIAGVAVLFVVIVAVVALILYCKRKNATDAAAVRYHAGSRA